MPSIKTNTSVTRETIPRPLRWFMLSVWSLVVVYKVPDESLDLISISEACVVPQV